MLEILKDYGKTQVNPKEVARVFGECVGLTEVALPHELMHHVMVVRYDGLFLVGFA